jgi:hypothetical protein
MCFWPGKNYKNNNIFKGFFSSIFCQLFSIIYQPIHKSVDYSLLEKPFKNSNAWSMKSSPTMHRVETQDNKNFQAKIEPKLVQKYVIRKSMKNYT